MNNNVEALVTLLGEENVVKIKDVITEEIIKNVRESIQMNYLVLPSDISDMVNEVFEEARDELMEEYRSVLKTEFGKLLAEKFKEER